MAYYMLTSSFRLDMIYPADKPRVAVISGHGICLRLQQTVDNDNKSNIKDVPIQVSPTSSSCHLQMSSDDPTFFRQMKILARNGQNRLTSPGGIIVDFGPRTCLLNTTSSLTSTNKERLIVNKTSAEDSWVTGRAGMQYRDMIPGRFGGAVIASHIRIPDGGPVPDFVHYHTVKFQLIFCQRGWVDVVYEDQGPPFRLNAGDCVLQPPKIRHRVLRASKGLEVVEIGLPAEHLTEIDHEVNTFIKYRIRNHPCIVPNK